MDTGIGCDASATVVIARLFDKHESQSALPWNCGSQSTRMLRKPSRTSGYQLRGMTVILFGVGLVSFPSFTYAAAFVALATIEGQFITPTVLGRRMTLNPLAVLLALAFWAWIWGPMGAFLAVPLTIVGVVTLHHLFPADESRLPG